MKVASCSLLFFCVHIIIIMIIIQACGLHNQVMTLGQLLKTNLAALAVFLMKTMAINHSIPAYGSVIKIKNIKNITVHKYM